MTLNEKLNSNTTLHYVDAYSSHFNENDYEIVETYQLAFSFYDCNYMVTVSAKDIEEDRNFILTEGDSRLFESFNEACEDDHWELIKERCKQFEVWLNDSK